MLAVVVGFLAESFIHMMRMAAAELCKNICQYIVHAAQKVSVPCLQ